jgi:glutathione synthase/RimK-type ligase-like ATP-grasp enzyme
VPTVATVWVEGGAEIDVEAVLAERGWEEAVVKPAVDLGAKNLHRVRASAGDAQPALEAVLARGKAMIQPFLSSLEAEGELSLIYIDGAFSHAVRKRPAQGDFRVQSIWGGTFEGANPDSAQLAVGERALGQLNEPPPYARVDLVEDLTSQPALIELELIEPNLYLSTSPSAAQRLVDTVLTQL